MSGKLMLIDQSYGLETRVAIVQGAILEDFDYEFAQNKLKKGNIYLAKVMRIEPSLQAVFLDYGEEKNGFLAFAEIHPSYYHSDKKIDPIAVEKSSELIVDEEGEVVQRKAPSSFKIQDVIKRHQVLLVQVVKDIRGTKGAAFTTYISLPGKYSVFMTNTTKSTGISRKITSAEDRDHLKKIIDSLEIPESKSIVVRTAGLGKRKSDIKKDYDYLLRLWSDIEKKIDVSQAPCLIYEESDLLIRALRDLYTSDITEILIQGDDAFKKAKTFMRMFMPSSVKRVSLYEKDALFQSFGIEDQISAIYSNCVPLPSGGSIIINPTEALVAIDVNSARSTKEKHIDETALKTNLEAALTAARQLRLRDLSGLIVIDFIDMPSHKNALVEHALKEALKNDRARIQLGKISQFGLLEMSRQRLRQSLIESSSSVCPSCSGKGRVLSVYALSLSCLHQLEKEARERKENLVAHGPPAVISYLLNEKRSILSELEKYHQIRICLKEDPLLHMEDFVLDGPIPEVCTEKKMETKAFKEKEESKKKEDPVKKENPIKEKNSKKKENDPKKSSLGIFYDTDLLPFLECDDELVPTTSVDISEKAPPEKTSIPTKRSHRSRRGGMGKKKAVDKERVSHDVIVLELPEVSSSAYEKKS